jgi:hypothetical protein
MEVHKSRTMETVQDCGIQLGFSVGYWVGDFAEFVLGASGQKEK